MFKRLWNWAFPSKQKEVLTDNDITSLGFKKTVWLKGHIMYFKKGNMSLKWDFHVSHRQVTLKWGKFVRHIGIIETKDELIGVLKNINKYYGKGER